MLEAASLLPLISSLASPSDYLATVLLPSLRESLAGQDCPVVCSDGVVLHLPSLLLASCSPWLASLLQGVEEPGLSLPSRLFSGYLRAALQYEPMTEVEGCQAGLRPPEQSPGNPSTCPR